MNPFKGLLSRTDCRIHNKSESIIKLIPKSRIDGAPASSAVVRDELVKEIQPNKYIDVDSRNYDLNGRNHNMQINIHFVAEEVPTSDGKVQPKQPKNAASASGVGVATRDLVFFHHELKEKGEIYLTCGKGGKVMEVDKSLIK